MRGESVGEEEANRNGARQTQPGTNLAGTLLALRPLPGWPLQRCPQLWTHSGWQGAQQAEQQDSAGKARMRLGAPACAVDSAAQGSRAVAVFTGAHS